MRGLKKTKAVWLLSLAVAASGLLAPGQGVAHQAGKAVPLAEVEQKNEKLVREFMAAFSDLDMKKTASFLAEDFTFQNAMKGKREYGKKAFTDWWWGMVNNATLLEPTIVRLQVMGNTVLVENTFHYRDAENDMTFKGTKFFYIQDGKIREYQEYRLPPSGTRKM